MAGVNTQQGKETPAKTSKLRHHKAEQDHNIASFNTAINGDKSNTKLYEHDAERKAIPSITVNLKEEFKSP